MVRSLAPPMHSKPSGARGSLGTCGQTTALAPTSCHCECMIDDDSVGCWSSQSVADSMSTPSCVRFTNVECAGWCMTVGSLFVAPPAPLHVYSTRCGPESIATRPRQVPPFFFGLLRAPLRSVQATTRFGFVADSRAKMLSHAPQSAPA